VASCGFEAAAAADCADPLPSPAADLETGSPHRIPWLTKVAATWSLAGYQANSVVLANILSGELDAVCDLREAASGSDADSRPRSEADGAIVTVLDGIAAFAAVLVRDVNAVARLGSQATAALPGLGATMIDASNDNDDVDRATGGADSPASLSSLAFLGAYRLFGRSARLRSRSSGSSVTAQPLSRPSQASTRPR
jgi:hypothetical protein